MSCEIAACYTLRNRGYPQIFFTLKKTKTPQAKGLRGFKVLLLYSYYYKL